MRELILPIVAKVHKVQVIYNNPSDKWIIQIEGDFYSKYTDDYTFNRWAADFTTFTPLKFKRDFIMWLLGLDNNSKPTKFINKINDFYISVDMFLDKCDFLSPKTVANIKIAYKLKST